MPRFYVGLLLGLCLFTGGEQFGAWAQCATSTSFTGSLRVKNTLGCVPLQVEASSDLIGVENVRYVYEYDGNREVPTSVLSRHTYSKPGRYLLLQLSEKDGLPLRACTPVLVYDTLPPRVALTACGTRITLVVTDPLAFPMQYDFFVVNWDDGQLDTIRVGQPPKEHVFATADPRRIRVQGIHESDNCGGTTRLTFTPNQPPQISSVEPVQTGAQAVRIQIQNPSGLGLTLQQRVGNAAFGGNQAVPAGPVVSLTIPADTSQTTCYRVVPFTTCPGSNPSPEVCHLFPPAKPATADAYSFPSAFSPNNDGLNDGFGPIGTVPAGTYQLIITDRWGRLLFATNDPRQTWDGQAGGQPVPSGVYAYQVSTRTAGGQTRQTSGRLLLVR